MEGKSSPKRRPSLSRGTEGRKQSPNQISRAETQYLMSRKNVRQESTWGQGLWGFQEFVLRWLSEEIQGSGGRHATGT